MDNLEKVTSYGFISVESYISRPVDYDEIGELVLYAKQKDFKICPIGSGLSFSNVALIDRQISLDIKLLNKIIEFDIKNRSIIVQAGVKVTEILKVVLPHNLILNSLTGSYGNTIAGNISNDVNGKDTWKNGNFCSNVVEMKVMLSNGEIKKVSRFVDSEIFHAICGGLGLIGIILEVKLKLQPISGCRVLTQTIKCKNLEEQLLQFESLNPQSDDFAYSWTDGFANQKQFGRGLFEKANFIESSNTTKIDWNKYLSQKDTVFGLKTERFWKIIRGVYSQKVHKYAGYLKYYKPLIRSSKETLFPEYQYPMTKVLPQWNLLFYPNGFREIQMLFSINNFENAYIETLEFCNKSKINPFICAIRKHIPQEGLLSFANEGFSFTINFGLNDLPIIEKEHFENGLMNICIKYNGTVYLGKFPFISGDTFLSMYPKNSNFISVKNIVDNSNVLWSDAASIFLT